MNAFYFFYETLLPEFKAQGKTVIAVMHDDGWFHVADSGTEYGIRAACHLMFADLFDFWVDKISTAHHGVESAYVSLSHIKLATWTTCGILTIITRNSSRCSHKNNCRG